MTRRGFTFVEILVAMTLMGIISTAMYQVLKSNQRTYREQASKVEVNQNVRTLAHMLPYELRELDVSDPNGSDIGFFNDSSFSFRSWRSTYFLCQVPDSANLKIVINPNIWYGLDTLDLTQHKLVLYAENNFTTRSDDAWYSSNSSGIVAGSACPSAGASRTITVTAISKAQLSGVHKGAPLRAYQSTRLYRYVDANGDLWLGRQTQSAATNLWTVLSPIAGPLSANGLRFTWYDAAGNVTTTAAQVARVGISISVRSQERSVARGGAQQYLSTDLSTQVALRNNRRW